MEPEIQMQQAANRDWSYEPRDEAYGGGRLVYLPATTQAVQTYIFWNEMDDFWQAESYNLDTAEVDFIYAGGFSTSMGVTEKVFLSEREVVRENIIRKILGERSSQIEKWGFNQNTQNGTGPGVHWLGEAFYALNQWNPEAEAPRAENLEFMFRHDYSLYEHVEGRPTFMHLVREEIAEVFKEDDPERLEEELIQVAALCVNWIENLRTRRG